MPSVLVTGSSGQVGAAVVEHLERQGWSVRRFDLRAGEDLRDAVAVQRAASGCDVVVHAGAIAHDRSGSAEDIVATNVLGTWNVLLAAERHRLSRVVYFSSAQVFGFADGDGTPDYRPVDDAHPLRAARPYGMSKRLAEDMCEAWSSRTGIPTVVLRPVMILPDSGLEQVSPDEAELGAFIHLDDVVSATVAALTAPVASHVRLTICGPGEFDTTAARRVLGWAPTRTWER